MSCIVGRPIDDFLRLTPIQERLKPLQYNNRMQGKGSPRRGISTAAIESVEFGAIVFVYKRKAAHESYSIHFLFPGDGVTVGTLGLLSLNP